MIIVLLVLMGVVVRECEPELQMSWQASLLNLKRKTGPPLGLRNLGNSCYLNSVLQCLTYTPPLANFCLRSQHSSLCDSALDAERKRECPFCLVEKRIALSLKGDYPSDAPAKIQNCLKIFAEHFRSGRQEDAHEFLRYVIDACHNTSLRLKKLQRKGSDSLNDSTIVKEIFGGALQSQVKCLSCGFESNKVDEIMDISLDILHSNSLKHAMQKFFQPEVLDGNNKYNCENCKKLVAARKQMSILRAPNILVIQLKRFEGVFGGKIDKALAFEETLILSGLMCKQNQDLQPQYDLFGTIVHSGYSPDSGHYYAYIKDAMGRWFCCNDSYVTVATPQEVLSEKVYVLFFSLTTNQRPGSVSSSIGSNGVKSRDTNGNGAFKSPKAAFPKTLHTKSNVEQSTPSKNAKMSFTPKVKFDIVGKSGSKAAPSTVNGSASLHESQQVETNGSMKDPFHTKEGNKVMLTNIDRTQNGKVDVKGEHYPIASANGNGTTLGLKANGNGTTPGLKANGPKDNSVQSDIPEGTTSTTSALDRGSNNHEQHNGVDCHFGNSGSKRKRLEESCILLLQDAQSQLKLEEFKVILTEIASSNLRSSIWYRDVHKHMHETKKICVQEAGNESDMKKLLIADAKQDFLSKIPEALKAELINLIRSLNKKK